MLFFCFCFPAPLWNRNQFRLNGPDRSLTTPVWPTTIRKNLRVKVAAEPYVKLPSLTSTSSTIFPKWSRHDSIRSAISQRA